jgi:hypothetical protein
VFLWCQTHHPNLMLMMPLWVNCFQMWIW